MANSFLKARHSLFNQIFNALDLVDELLLFKLLLTHEFIDSLLDGLLWFGEPYECFGIFFHVLLEVLLVEVLLAICHVVEDALHVFRIDWY